MRKLLFLTVATAALGGCLTTPPAPPAPYHAVGVDSAWNAIIDDKHVTFIAAGKQPITQPVPQPINGVAGEIYQTPRINVNIVHQPCVANGRTFPDIVQVYVDGIQYRGCGGL